MEMSQDSVDISLHGVCVLDLYQCASDVDDMRFIYVLYPRASPESSLNKIVT